jgi:hypothetical protein
MYCWEFKHCGREKGGVKSKIEGVCPAYPSHGKHCARVVGTMCNGEVIGTFAKKIDDCLECDFYQSEHYDNNFDGVIIKK